MLKFVSCPGQQLFHSARRAVAPLAFALQLFLSEGSGEPGKRPAGPACVGDDHVDGASVVSPELGGRVPVEWLQLGEFLVKDPLDAYGVPEHGFPYVSAVLQW